MLLLQIFPMGLNFSPVSFIKTFLSLQKKRFSLIAILDSITWPLDALLWPYILNQTIEIFFRYQERRAFVWESLLFPVLLALLLVFYVEIASRVMGYWKAKALPQLQGDVRSYLFDHIQKHSPSYFNQKFAGALSNQLNDVTSQVEQILNQIFWPILPSITACLFGGLCFFLIYPPFAWIFFSWMAIHLTICILFTKKCSLYEQTHSAIRSALVGKIVDSFTNNFAVNLYHRFRFEKEKIVSFQKQEIESNIQAQVYVEKMRMVLSASFFIFVIVILLGALIHFWIQGKITTGDAAQIFTTSWSLAVILWNVGASIPVMFQSLGLLKQGLTLLADPQDLGDRKEPTQLTVSQGRIVFDQVQFSYHLGGRHFSYEATIEAGEKIGLVGLTGAGKSTFIHLLLRFFQPTSGSIAIDDQSISLVSLESLRNSIAVIPQDPILFHRSVEENIGYGNLNASKEEIVEAAKKAHCHEFILNLPNQYKTLVGERGAKLSGGEKQRIVIARAILANAPILILDEATSSLDSMTEHSIQEALSYLMQNRTTLVIAHRLSTLSKMDRLFVFDKGSIVEIGSHKALMKKNGLYTKLWELQVGGFVVD